jgi:hypothetical protein
VFAVRLLFGLYVMVALGTLISGTIPPPGAGIGAQRPPASARIEAAGVADHVGGLVIRIDEVAVDESSKVLWVHVTVGNSDATEAEWSGTANVIVSGAKISSDYARSTHLPGDVDPGQVVSGWIMIPLGSTAVPRGDVIAVRFPDVAVHNYQIVDDIDLRLAV